MTWLERGVRNTENDLAWASLKRAKAKLFFVCFIKFSLPTSELPNDFQTCDHHLADTEGVYYSVLGGVSTSPKNKQPKKKMRAKPSARFLKPVFV